MRTDEHLRKYTAAAVYQQVRALPYGPLKQIVDKFLETAAQPAKN